MTYNKMVELRNVLNVTDNDMVNARNVAVAVFVVERNMTQLGNKVAIRKDIQTMSEIAVLDLDHVMRMTLAVIDFVNKPLRGAVEFNTGMSLKSRLSADLTDSVNREAVFYSKVYTALVNADIELPKHVITKDYQ